MGEANKTVTGRDYATLVSRLREEYARHAPSSAALQDKATRLLTDGGSNALRTIRPFPPRIVKARGAWITDEDGHSILDFWQGHYANVLGHNPQVVTKALAQILGSGYGLQTGFTDRWQVEVAEILCRQCNVERVRFTTSGTLATMYAIMLARAATKRQLVMKVGGGWHGGHPWGLKGVGYHDGFGGLDSDGLSTAGDDVTITGFNDLGRLEADFRRYGERTACLILEPVIGAGGLMPARRDYVAEARKLTRQYGALLVLDEVITAFRFRAGNVARLYGVDADLTTMGKAIGGGLPVAAVAGRADVMDQAGLDQSVKVKFQGGTFAAHPASMLAAKTLLTYLVEHEAEIYPRMRRVAVKTREAVKAVFAEEGITARFAGETIDVLGGNSLHMLVFPYEEGVALDRPEQVRNPAICDVTLAENVLQLAMLLENVYTVHGLGCTTAAHTEEDAEVVANAFRRAARRVKPYL